MVFDAERKRGYESAVSLANGRGTEQFRVPKASELVAGDLRRQIVRKELREGDALPPEAELMLHFGVSRPTLREAFRILESERLISVRRGARGGARVHLPDIGVAAQYAGLLLQEQGATLADVYAALLVIEPPLTGLLAKNQPQPEIEELRAILAAEADALSKGPDGLAPLFARFQRVIVEGSGKLTLGVMAGMLANIIEKHLLVAASGRRGRPEREGDNRRVFRAHTKLLQLVEARDQEGAEAFWRRYMGTAGELLLKEYGSTTVVDLLD
jgi:DNA-binding FadR family transcriptional regulator